MSHYVRTRLCYDRPQQTISIADGELPRLKHPGHRSTAIHERVGRVNPRINGWG
jgi:hypothetical protein